MSNVITRSDKILITYTLAGSVLMAIFLGNVITFNLNYVKSISLTATILGTIGFPFAVVGYYKIINILTEPDDTSSKEEAKQ